MRYHPFNFKILRSISPRSPTKRAKSMIVADEELRLCESCLTVHPAPEFRRRFASGDIRLGQCRACHNTAERERRAAQRAQRDHVKIGKFAKRVKHTTTLSRAEILCAEMIQEFGGLAGFVAAWVVQVKRACNSQPGSKRTLDFFLAVVHLLELREASAPDLEGLTDADLEQLVREQLQHLIKDQPELAIEAAEQLGWQVIPRI